MLQEVANDTAVPDADVLSLVAAALEQAEASEAAARVFLKASKQAQTPAQRVELLQHVVRLDPAPEHELVLGRALLGLGASAAAAPHLVAAGQELGDKPELQVIVAELRRKEGSPQKALELVAAVLDAHPDHIEALTVRCRALADTGAQEEALAEADRLVALRPTDRALRALHARLLLAADPRQALIEEMKS